MGSEGDKDCLTVRLGFTVGAVAKDSAANAGDAESRLDPWVGKIPWRREWQPTPVFLPGESYGEGSLEGCNPWGGKESDTT